MKRSLLTGIGLSLLTSLNVIGCATDEGSECLPGDIDCAEDLGGTDGKGDAWDYKNDPSRMSQRLQYRLSELPKKGNLETPTWKDRYPNAVGVSPVAWADTYWPTSAGSHNTRWQGNTVKSPLEKYDAAFNNAAGCEKMPTRLYGTDAKAQWDEYYRCAGPAAKWQSKEFQGGGEMHDGIDNDGDGKVDDYGSDGIDGIAGWWGTCHAWAPSALTEPEPQRAVTVNGVTFEVADVKALIQNMYDGTSAVMLGGRCNSKEISHDPTKSANNECSDVNPGALHVVITNFLGIAQLPLVEDRTANYEVWNQPVVGYEVTKQAEISKTAANTCVGGTGGSTWTYNPDAKKLYEVKMTVKYVTEGDASTQPLGFASYTRSDNYHYILELNDDGKVVGGRYCTDSDNTHVDFLWSPTGRTQPSNPYVSSSKVKELIAKATGPDQGGGGGTGKTFEASPNAAIPDNDPTGVSVDLRAEGLTGSPALTVSLDISHSYRGDLVVELLKDGNRVKVLHDQAGGSADDLKQAFALTAAEVGSNPNGTWTVRVVDTYEVDTGTVNKVSLTFN